MVLPFAFALPFSTALVAVIEVAASVVTTGGGGDATNAKLCKDMGPLLTPANLSSGLSADELTATGVLLETSEPLPSSPSPLNPHDASVPSMQSARLAEEARELAGEVPF